MKRKEKRQMKKKKESVSPKTGYLKIPSWGRKKKEE
jgi:hypothetical protein